ncbi:UNVERIFIED_CONTAM: hypothetical protein K2H54_056718 [Gekko kuhli]
MSGVEGEEVPTTTDTTTNPPVTEAPNRLLPSPYPMFPLIPQGQLTQWGQFNPDSTTETYVLTEGPRRDSRWDLPGPLVYQPIPGDGLGETSSMWTEMRPRDREALVEDQVELEDNEYEDKEEDWGPRLVALEKGQQKTTEPGRGDANHPGDRGLSDAG